MAIPFMVVCDHRNLRPGRGCHKLRLSFCNLARVSQARKRHAPGFSPYFTQWKPDLSQGQARFVPGRRAAERGYVLKVDVPFLLASFLPGKLNGSLGQGMPAQQVRSQIATSDCRMNGSLRSGKSQGIPKACTIPTGKDTCAFLLF